MNGLLEASKMWAIGTSLISHTTAHHLSMMARYNAQTMRETYAAMLNAWK